MDPIQTDLNPAKPAVPGTMQDASAGRVTDGTPPAVPKEQDWNETPAGTAPRQNDLGD